MIELTPGTTHIEITQELRQVGHAHVRGHVELILPGLNGDKVFTLSPARYRILVGLSQLEVKISRWQRFLAWWRQHWRAGRDAALRIRREYEPD